MILTRLKNETRERHEWVERTLGLLDAPPSVNGYHQLLRRFFGYYEPVEEHLAALPWEAAGFDWPPRRKLPLLERDLHSLGDSPEQISALPRCPDLPPLSTLTQAIGCLYVLEGSTLGGQFITRHLSSGSCGPLPTAFFASYGEKVGRMWNEFGTFATSYAAGRGEDDVIVDSACRTFDTLGTWLAGRPR